MRIKTLQEQKDIKEVRIMENLTKKELLMISNCIIRAMTEIRESKKVLDFYNIPSDDNALLEYEQLNYKVLDLIPESKED